METLNLTPRGNVKVTKDYGVRTVTYESGARSFQRQWINPRITYSFSVEGDEAMRKYIDNFVDSVHGNFDKFYWVYNGETLTCRMGDSKVEWEHIRGYGGEGCVGYKATVSIANEAVTAATSKISRLIVDCGDIWLIPTMISVGDKQYPTTICTIGKAQPATGTELWIETE